MKRVYNALPKVVDFLRVLRFPPTGKVDWVGWVIRAHIVIDSRCCGDFIRVSKKYFTVSLLK